MTGFANAQACESWAATYLTGTSNTFLTPGVVDSTGSIISGGYFNDIDGILVKVTETGDLVFDKR